ncbi:MAG: translation elongation factor 4 [Candidatus Moranbacteria bacterium]|nr:translation elongation factor 4 [Candidatus Moranbacteria bacterium]
MTNNTRNFCIIAHIDHGKSTLADRLLEETATVEKRKMKEQLLDTMALERERGITIKLQPVQMKYKKTDGNEYVLNLIDTPGHVDFAYEVSRSLAAVEGAVLLVDATQGVQAQTLSNLYFAIEHDLEIIPVVNKIDLPNADPVKVKREIASVIGCSPESVLEVSGKTGQGVSKLLEQIIERVPAPEVEEKKPLRALIFDSIYDSYKGVLTYVRIMEGTLSQNETVRLMVGGVKSTAIEIGHFKPHYVPCKTLSAGDIGYIATGLKSVAQCRVGDTVTGSGDNQSDEILEGYKEVRPMVYASFYPLEGDEYTAMRDALEKLTLNDAAFVFEPESNRALGRGFRCGFLGLLHLEIIQSRLESEFDIHPTITTPSVVYHVMVRGESEPQIIYSPTEMPDPGTIEQMQEPFVKLEIVTPSEYLGTIMDVMGKTRAEYRDTQYLDTQRVLLSFNAPLIDVIVQLHDMLKGATAGFASMNYEAIGYRSSELVKLDIMIAGDMVEALSRIVPKKQAYAEGKHTVEKLKELLPRQNFAVAIQATIGAKIIARETLSAFRKDVTAKLYGGDVTRKRKLLEKQKKGKKRMKQTGKIDVPPKAFFEILKK